MAAVDAEIGPGDVARFDAGPFGAAIERRVDQPAEAGDVEDAGDDVGGVERGRRIERGRHLDHQHAAMAGGRLPPQVDEGIAIERGQLADGQQERRAALSDHRVHGAPVAHGQRRGVLGRQGAGDEAAPARDAGGGREDVHALLVTEPIDRSGEEVDRGRQAGGKCLSQPVGEARQIEPARGPQPHGQGRGAVNRPARREMPEGERQRMMQAHIIYPFTAR